MPLSTLVTLTWQQSQSSSQAQRKLQKLRLREIFRDHVLPCALETDASFTRGNPFKQ
jgi:hypothetical protein